MTPYGSGRTPSKNSSRQVHKRGLRRKSTLRVQDNRFASSDKLESPMKGNKTQKHSSKTANFTQQVSAINRKESKAPTTDSNDIV